MSVGSDSMSERPAATRAAARVLNSEFDSTAWIMRRGGAEDNKVHAATCNTTVR